MQSVTNDSQEPAPGMEILCCVRSQHDKRCMDIGNYAGARFFETVILKLSPALDIFRLYTRKHRHRVAALLLAIVKPSLVVDMTKTS